MSIFRSLLLFAVLLFAPAAQAATSELALAGDNFWVVLASAKDLDEAVGVGSSFYGVNVQVLKAVNGWFAVVAGPFSIPTGTGREFLDKQIKVHGFSKDAYLTRGASFIERSWQPSKIRFEANLAYDGEHDASLRKGDLELTLTRQRVDSDSYAPVAAGTYKGKEAFKIVISDNASEKPSSNVALLRLDGKSKMPQVIFTYYWQGAHCCTITKIASLSSDGTWHVTTGDTLDGGGGYGFERLDQSGDYLLTSADQNFLYAFSSYAGSVAPLRIQRFHDDQLEDVTKDASFQHRILQDLYRIKRAKPTDGESEVNGYYAGFIAASLLAQQGDPAWAEMLKSYDHEADVGLEHCTTPGVEIYNCADDKKVKLPYPKALRQFLSEHGYMSDPDRFVVPDEGSQPVLNVQAAQSSGSGASRQLQICAGASDTVRKLIYQTFAGRNVAPGESYDAVSLQGDTTLEAYDAGIQKVTCAVTYQMPLRLLIGRLAEEGNMPRVMSLTRLSRNTGGTASQRVHYTVKPTATAGTSYVELLP